MQQPVGDQTVQQPNRVGSTTCVGHDSLPLLFSPPANISLQPPMKEW